MFLIVTGEIDSHPCSLQSSPVVLYHVYAVFCFPALSVLPFLLPRCDVCDADTVYCSTTVAELSPVQQYSLSSSLGRYIQKLEQLLDRWL